jgi:ABC-type lipoprotein export system ATPase subunit
MLWRERVDDHLAGCDAAVVDALVPPGLRSRSPLALSGGEAQRVALAATLGRPAPLVLLDEPEAHLDDAGRAALAAILARRAAEGAVLVAATHDPQLQALAHTRTEVGA